MRKAIFFLTVLFLSNVPSLYYGWYLRWDWVDAVQHFLGGLFIGMLMYYYLKDHFLPNSLIKNTLILAGATVFIGVIWEFAEYIANQTLIEPFYNWFGIRAYFMGDLNDTIGDLTLDTLGGLTFWGLHLLWSRKSQDVEA